MQRRPWAARLEQLDPEVDALELYRLVCAHEFPWDVQQALSFALFRTYAVPSIGRLLAETGELVSRTAKRYEDTGLLLDAVLEHGPDSPGGRTALRRINAMHAAYDTSDEDLRYVLCTFVAVPIRWMDAFGWRPFTEAEKRACARYNRELGRRMGIRDLPTTWQESTALLDAYELAHFGPDEGGRAVARATLELFTQLPPQSRLPARLVRAASYAVMDDPLLDALGFPRPHPVVRRAVHRALRLRGAVVRHLPPRTRPRWFRMSSAVRGYPDGFELSALGTFPRGCPVPRDP